MAAAVSLHSPCSLWERPSGALTPMERSACPMSPSQVLFTCPPDPGHLHGCGRRPHLALQGHLCPETHVLVSEIRTHHPLARRCPGGCDLAGGRGAVVRHQESWSSWFGLGGGRRVGGGGWGLAGSPGEVLSAVLINYLPATGLLAALGCLLANAVSHALSGMWMDQSEESPTPSENDVSTWHPRHLKSSCPSRVPHMQALLHTTHAGYSYTLLTALPSQSLALGEEGGTDSARGF